MLKESLTFSTTRTPSSYPASRERHLQGCRSDVRVPYREITLSDTRHRDQTETNPFRSRLRHLWPYLDPKTAIRLTRGLPALRSDWIKEREDTGIFTLRSSSLGSIK
jgi:phosphomethylpyrimidine synthase